MCGAVLDKFEQEEKFRPEWLDSLISPVETVFRACFALLSPVPQHHGSSVDDVNFLIPPNARVGPVRDMGKHGKVLCSWTKKNVKWKEIHDRYLAVASSEIVFGPAIKDLEKKLNLCYISSAFQENPGDDADCDNALKQYAENAPRWRPALRSGAMASLETEVYNVIKMRWDHVMSRGEHNVAEATLLQSICCHLPAVQSYQELADDLSTRMLEWQESSSKTRLQAAAHALEKEIAPLQAVTEFWAVAN